MRLGVVVTVPWGGLLHYGVQLADALADRGHQVDIVAPRGNEMASHAGPARMRPILTPPVRSAPSRGSGARYVLRRAGVAVRLTRAWARVLWQGGSRRRYDVLLIDADFELLPAAVLALVLSIRPGRPTLIVVCHNVKPFNRHGGSGMFIASSGLAARLMRRVYERSDLVLVHGEQSRAEFEALYPSTRLAVIPLGHERLFGAAPPPATEERVLFFGHWAKVKGLPILMEAFDSMAARRPEARLTIAGTPVPADFDPDVVRRWAATYGERVEIVDHYVPLQNVAALFARARVVVTPYLVAYQSAVVHLAMTMGRAVVASRVGDLPASVIEGETGLLVPPGDPGALADALADLLSDPARAHALGAAGRRRVLDQNSWETVAEQVERAIVALSPP